MIVAKTKMKKIPESCKKCKFKNVYYRFCLSAGATCDLTGLDCPTEKKPSGNIGYSMPEWCPLMDIDFVQED